MSLSDIVVRYVWPTPYIRATPQLRPNCLVPRVAVIEGLYCFMTLSVIAAGYDRFVSNQNSSPLILFKDISRSTDDVMNQS